MTAPRRPLLRNVRTTDDVLRLMDDLFDEGVNRWSADSGGAWWDRFYDDRTSGVPFFADAPDENLVEFVSRRQPGRALDLGCGNGRNARFLAAQGFEVDAIDLSESAIAWAREHGSPSSVSYVVGDAFGAAGESLSGPYDLVYDSGCLHHLPPHRRVSYLSLLDRVLSPGGWYGVVCFAEGAMGSERADEDLYRRGGLDGGLAFNPDSLRWIFSEFEEVEIRPMKKMDASSGLFGEPFLLTGTFRRRA